jgi:hypothetical protein
MSISKSRRLHFIFLAASCRLMLPTGRENVHIAHPEACSAPGVLRRALEVGKERPRCRRRTSNLFARVQLTIFIASGSLPSTYTPLTGPDKKLLRLLASILAYLVVASGPASPHESPVRTLFFYPHPRPLFAFKPSPHFDSSNLYTIHQIFEEPLRLPVPLALRYPRVGFCPAVTSAPLPVPSSKLAAVRPFLAPTSSVNLAHTSFLSSSS